MEGAAFKSATVHSDGVQVQLSLQGKEAKNNLAAGAGGEGARLEVALGEDSKVTACGCPPLILFEMSVIIGSSSDRPVHARRKVVSLFKPRCWWMQWAASAQ